MISYKTPREQAEWTTLCKENPSLTKAVHSLDYFCEAEFGKNIVLTSVFRTQAEHDALYAQTPPAQRPATSPHCRWEAVDIRSHAFTSAEIARMVSFLNQFVSGFPGKPTALYHAIPGGAPHFHAQRKRP
jgi:hypothetical protein